MLDQDRIIKVDINESMKKSYIDYSMSVIVARALPDVRDGFKPVHRRILYGMMELGNTYDKPYKKCARIVGEVLGKYHPHGDSSVYGALVRLAQDWAMRYCLVDGQGNFGSVDGDGAAAMRYTEARLTRLGEAMMDDLYKETVDFEDNFDGSLKEPKVLPTRIPNLLVNGATGIAVGMATNIPTHNLGEVIDGCVAMIDNPEITTEGLMKYIKAPDFPTGGIICGLDGVKEAYETGRGRIIIRSKTDIETEATHDKIVVHEIPYNVNKSELIKKIAELVTDKKIDGISNVNDESDREGMRIVIDLKRDANANVVLNKLYKMTDLQSSFSVNCIALIGAGANNSGRPKLLSLQECIKYFVDHRHDVTIRRTKFDKRKAEERAHILEGLIIASDNIDEVVHIIRAAKSPQEAIENLKARFNLDDIQAKAIVEMRLRQLTGLEQDKLHAEYDELEKLIAYLQSILDDPELCKKVMKDELLEVKNKWGDERKTVIDYSASNNFNPEDFYPNEPVVVTVSHLGYIKRTPLTEFRAQGRGGVGSKGGSARDQDFIEYIYPATTHNTMMFFTKKGRCFWMKVYEIPEGPKTFKGRAVQNLLNIDSDDKATAFITIENINDADFVKRHNLMFCTKRGTVKKTRFENYAHPRSNGLIAINLVEGDEVIEVKLTTGNDDIIIANHGGRAIRFNEQGVRVMGRTATGVRGIRLDGDDDEAVGMLVFNCNEELTDEQWAALDAQESNETEVPETDAVEPVEEVEGAEEITANEWPENILVVSEKGFGKRSVLSDYRITKRGGKGVKTLNVTEKTGNLIAIKSVTDDDDLMIINKSGVAIRLAVREVKVQGRNTQGVSLINLKRRNDVIASVCKVVHEEPEEDALEENSEEAGNMESSEATNE
ncbi:MAG: DNA gyrase subunit A [Bacteroidaceae bacterium]|nr:DNA gyrase subunit A [Bacteroidaceae bacterium]